MLDIFLSISVLLYFIFILFIISGLFKHTIINSSIKTNLPNVSVVVAARNEQENLPDLLTDFINQNYPKDKIEFIIVDDRSTDKTPEILKEITKKHKFIKQIKLTKKSPHMTPKKHALNEGIKNSTGEIIISTDADCRVGKNWVLSMTKGTLKTKGITIGFSKINAITNFDKYQLFDFLGIITANAGASGWGYFWSGTGQNLAYFKEDYEKINGFEPVKNEISGDDMYLVQSISKLKKGFFNIDPQSYVTTMPRKTLKGFINQRIRWASNSKKNIFTNKLFFLFLLSSFLINTLILLSIFFNTTWVNIFFIKSILEGLTIFLGAKLFNTKIKLLTFITWAIIQPFYIPYISIMGLQNKFTWKP